MITRFYYFALACLNYLKLLLLDYDLCPLCYRVVNPRKAKRQIKIENKETAETEFKWICDHCNDNVEQMRHDDALKA